MLHGSDDRQITYDVTELDELVLAYATTIHKSQGSEYPVVVMPVLMNHYVMLQRNLIYTGITRAKRIMVIVGTKKTLSFAVRNVTVSSRNTMLKDRLIRLQAGNCTAENRTRENPEALCSHVHAGDSNRLISEGSYQRSGINDKSGYLSPSGSERKTVQRGTMHRLRPAERKTAGCLWLGRWLRTRWFTAATDNAEWSSLLQQGQLIA